MEFEQTNDDLRDLIENPRENEGIEMKAWVDLDDQTQKAKLARHVGALANHGGGYLVFGFNDDLTHDQNRPSSLEKYNRDTFAGIAKRYLTPIFQCDVFSVTHSNGNEFSVVRVPGHKDVPIAAKADGPQDGRGRLQGIVKGTYYIRKPGPESAAISGAEEWSPLIRRCVLENRDQLLSDITSLLQTRVTRGPTGRQQLEEWHNDSERRFLDLLSQAEGFQWPVPLEENCYQLSYLISSDGIDPFPVLCQNSALLKYPINQQLRVCVCDRAQGRARTNDEIMQAWCRQTGDQSSSVRADE